ncbi:MAG: hypothetical protein PHQ65_12440 [Bacteroidales bacterium]|nr:hypothetical protein [Bacteroidales bacterium]
MVKTLFKYVLILLTFPLAVQAYAQQGVSASVDTTHLIIGQQTHLTLTFRFPEGARAGWPQWGDTLTGAIDIVKRSKLDTLPAENGLVGLRQVLTLTVFDSGQFWVPPIQVGYMRENDTAPTLLVTNAIPLYVNTVEVDTTQAFRDIKEPVKAPVTIGEVIPWALGGLVAAILITVIVWVVRQRLRKESIIPERRKVVLPADVEALQRLDELRLKKLWQAGEVKFYYTELTDIMRVYLERRFAIQAAEMTSAEIMEGIQHLKLHPTTTQLLDNMLQLADLVKFARMQPLPLENDTALNHAVDFVKETRPVAQPQPATEAENQPPSNQLQES